MSDVALIRGRAYIAGEWVETTAHLDVLDPATGERLGSVPRCGAEEARAAVDGASGVFEQWRSLSAIDRAAPLQRMARSMERREEELATLLTREQGKPLTEARAEIRYAASFLTWFAEEARRIYGETIPAPSADRRVFVLRQPVGVGIAITPWNFPCAMITRKLGPALAAGCPLILKPAEATPLSALALAAIAEQAGIPAGGFSVLTGDRDDAAELGAALIADPRVRKLSFTGSTAVGKKLLEASASTVKRVSLELGGNAPFVVLDDADVDAAVAGCLVAKFRNAGRSSIAGRSTKSRAWSRTLVTPALGRRSGAAKPKSAARFSPRPCSRTFVLTCASAGRKSSDRWRRSRVSGATRKGWRWPTGRRRV